MPHTKDFLPASLQASVFTPEASVSSAAFLTKLLPGWMDRFDGDPVTLPFGEGAPPEIPKVILQSKTQAWRCEVASARMNVIWRAVNEDSAISLGDFYDVAVRLIDQYADFVRSPIRRVAAIAIRYAPQPDPGRYLAKHFCQDRWLTAPFNRPQSFELHAHKQFELTPDLVVNSWVRSKSGQVNGRDPVIIVEQDLNTPAENLKNDYADAGLHEFFAAATSELDRILELYYPAEIE